MYEKKIAYKNYKDRVRNEEHTFQLEVRDVFKNMVELQGMFTWIDGLREEQDLRDLPTDEVVTFYNNLEAVLLASWGVIDESGDRFVRDGRYMFEDSKAFAIIMEEFLMDQKMANEFLTAIMPAGMEEMVKRADEIEAAAIAALAKGGDNKTPAELQAEIAQLRAQMATAPTEGESAPAAVS